MAFRYSLFYVPRSPVVVQVHAIGVEPFELPPNPKVKLLVLGTVLDCVYNGLLLFGILIATPLFMSVGCMLVMPASIVVDRIANRTELAPGAIVGAVLILVAFFLLNVTFTAEVPTPPPAATGKLKAWSHDGSEETVHLQTDHRT